MNKVILIGRLARDTSLKTGASGTPYCNFTLAVDRSKKDDGADFISCIAFGKSAENLNAYKRKGDQIAVEGHIVTGSYEAKDGRKVYTTDVAADRIEFVGNGGQKRSEYREPEDYEGFMAVEEETPF